MFFAARPAFYIQRTNKTFFHLASKRSSFLLILVPYILLIAGCNHDYDIRFYTFEKAYDYQPAKKVPLKPGTNYGWITKAPLNTDISWREELTLPNSPGKWANESESSDTLITQKTEQAQPSGIHPDRQYGLIGNFWTVAPDDPAGLYQYKIYIDGKLIKSLEIDFYKE